MATKSEQYKAETERSSRTKRSAKKKPSRPKATARRNVKTATTTKAHGTKKTSTKAVFALEKATGGKRPSRKSTRASAHHERPDTNLTLRQEARTTSPEARFRRSKAQATRTRGK